MTEDYENFIASFPKTTIVLSSVTHLDDLPSADTDTLKPEIAEWCDASFAEPWRTVRYSAILTKKAESIITVLEVGCIEDAMLFRLRWY